MYFYLEPEVAGGIGPNSELHREDGKLIVTRLNYEFYGWLGDALLETTPCFIVTDEARHAIESAALTGITFSDVEVTRSGIFTDLYGEKVLPHFWWLVVVGHTRHRRFWIGQRLTTGRIGAGPRDPQGSRICPRRGSAPITSRQRAARAQFYPVPGE